MRKNFQLELKNVQLINRPQISGLRVKVAFNGN